MREGNEDGEEFSICALSRQSEKEAEHEAGNYVNDQSQDSKNDGVLSDALILDGARLNLFHFNIINSLQANLIAE